jgi:hypothetical protein
MQLKQSLITSVGQVLEIASNPRWVSEWFFEFFITKILKQEYSKYPIVICNECSQIFGGKVNKNCWFFASSFRQPENSLTGIEEGTKAGWFFDSYMFLIPKIRGIGKSNTHPTPFMISCLDSS